jgi:hypothetical protein
MGFGIVCIVIGAGFVAAWAWMGVQAWRDDREIARAERESAERFAERAPEIEAARSRSAARLPNRPHALRASVLPGRLDEVEVAADANRLIAAAVAMCRRDAELQANTALMDQYATQHPMKQRPRLVERQADPEINSGGEKS